MQEVNHLGKDRISTNRCLAFEALSLWVVSKCAPPMKEGRESGNVGCKESPPGRVRGVSGDGERGRDACLSRSGHFAGPPGLRCAGQRAARSAGNRAVDPGHIRETKARPAQI